MKNKPNKKQVLVDTALRKARKSSPIEMPTEKSKRFWWLKWVLVLVLLTGGSYYYGIQ